MKRGFTLIELLVVAAIIAILTGFVLVNYPSFNRTFALQRSASKLAQDIRKVEERAVAMIEISGTPPDAYGIYFNTSTYPTSYKLSAYEKNGNQWSATDTWEEIVNLESGIEISALNAGGVSTSTLNIVFEPPDPTVWINNSSSSSSSITLCLETDSRTKTISVNSSGLITIE